ncbi:MAG: type I DNA topoisomerase [Candidatus Portnoybacteria bacterium CG03_land_8_20_14_0_80_41_10]|uniref:DNA topoisomerase 1 n=1 Tax=Candidatus Portnoybacteria bacterium CG03_land_8_20_14_0_80_41_10 TaxID=1974808 RepID=A0A2M7BU90_9BACT|nr:MAG: type I DNA topoisomerase [Candidatus Portnoybacteria bacterium CG03_land_8_20_14_0_80_41_10]
MNLVIVESPSKGKTIAKFLGRAYSVESSYGHIRDLPKGELGVDPERNFKPKYVIPVKARKIVKKLKEAAQKKELVILATDEDREGEAIAWHILQVLDSDKIKNYQRIVFHEITKKAILQALENPRQINMNLVNAQQARRILDRLVGYKLSPFLWKKLARGLSAGRVQSVAVRLIVDREREIEKFKTEEYWTIQAKLKKQDRPDEFIAHLIKKDGQIIRKLGIKNSRQADKALSDLKGAVYQVIDIKSKEVRRHPAAPFTTSALQQEAAKKLGFSAKQTMRLAQQLYEGVKGSSGLITYHRTDSLSLSAESLREAREMIQKEFGQKYALASPKIYKTKSKSAQEAHEAIRPTKVGRQPDKIKKYLDKNQSKLYDLIWRRFIACQMKPALLESTSVDIQAKNYLFRTTGSVIKFDGFLRVYPLKQKELILPSLAKEEMLKLIKLFSEQHFTQPPARYGEAALIKTLEGYGIGRPSTYAPIIGTIQERNYVQKNEQRKFAPTEIGFLVNDILVEHFPKIVDFEFTAQMENALDKIAIGKTEWTTTINDFYQPFQDNLTKKYEEVVKKKIEEPTDKKCPLCGRQLVIKLGRFGKFYACPGFPECKYSEPIVNSTGVNCPKCVQGEIIERKTRKGKTFYSCSRYPKCDFALWDKPTGEKCPRCGSLLVETKNKQVKCSNKGCDYGKK